MAIKGWISDEKLQKGHVKKHLTAIFLMTTRAAVGIIARSHNHLPIEYEPRSQTLRETTSGENSWRN